MSTRQTAVDAAAGGIQLVMMQRQKEQQLHNYRG